MISHNSAAKDGGEFNPSSVLRCPNDGSILIEKGAVVTCPHCSLMYRETREGVVDFVRDSTYYWGEIPREQMEAVLEHARNHGIDAAIDDYLGVHVDAAYRESLREPTRVDWRILLGMTAEHTVLDVGSGWGRLGFALAPWIRHLYSLEYVSQRLEFQRIMREQRGCRNITLLHGSFLDLPFQANSLDWIIFNGVLEWVGLAGTADPRRMQLDVLRRSFEIARPGGHVVVAIENRWGINTFFGEIDHSGLPYTNLMPRRMANWWVRRHAAKYRNDATNPGYRTYTYGLNGYQKLMREAGASDVTVYALLPHYNIPRAVIPLVPQRCSAAQQTYALEEIWQRASPAAALARMAVRALVRIGVMPHVYPHYLIVGSKPC
jgi:ubiquinone/menaquinone biosynthesis C-methylase UbiE